MAFRVSLSRHGQQAEEGSIQLGCFCPVVSYESCGEAADPTSRWIVLLSRIRDNSSRPQPRASVGVRHSTHLPKVCRLVTHILPECCAKWCVRQVYAAFCNLGMPD
jgi:hypothetical protein